MDLYSTWTGILIHHSAVKDNLVLSDYEAIRRFHTNWRVGGEIITEAKARELISSGRKDITPPWRDIGYHKVTECIKGRPSTRDGRPLWVRGAHEPEVNKTHVGWCFVGNFDRERPSDAIYDEGGREIAKLMRICSNIGRIEPHRKYSPKTCPGLLFDMGELEARIRFYSGKN